MGSLRKRIIERAHERRPVIERAYKAAKAAAEAKSAELDGRPDTVGNAWISMNGRSSVYRVLKALYAGGDRRFYVGDPRHVGVRACYAQSVNVQRAAAEAFAGVLNSWAPNVNARVTSYLD